MDSLFSPAGFSCLRGFFLQLHNSFFIGLVKTARCRKTLLCAPSGAAMPKRHERARIARPQKNLFSHRVKMENPANRAHSGSTALSRQPFGEILSHAAFMGRLSDKVRNELVLLEFPSSVTNAPQK